MKRLSHEATPERQGRVIFPSPRRSLPCVHCCVAYHAFTVSIAVFLSFAFPPLFFVFVVLCSSVFVFCTSVGRLNLQYASSLSLRVLFPSCSPRAARYSALHSCFIFSSSLLPVAFVCLVVWGIGEAQLWLGPHHLLSIFRIDSYRLR